MAFSVIQSECHCAKEFELDYTQVRDNNCGCLFVGMAICSDKPVGCLHKV
jgi:hypothetical protein